LTKGISVLTVRLFIAGALLAVAAPASAQHPGGVPPSSAPHHRAYATHSRVHGPKACASKPSHHTHVNPAPGTRDRHGRLKRSAEAKHAFMRQSGHPHGWPGHMIDHQVPLACGGSDTPGNMQWQTTAEAKAKDRVERKGCRKGRHH
jgi:hypothetical protein